MAPLFGERGLLPAAEYLSQIGDALGSRAAGFAALPSLFWIDASDATMRAACLLGLALALGCAAGLANAISMALLWTIYLSFVHVGQIFYGYGWEMLLL